MKYIAKPMTELPKPQEEAIYVSDVSIQRLIDDSLTVLYRETKNLMKLSVNGKLDAPNARDLRDNLKLLFELKEREDAALNNLTDEELEKLAKTDTKTEDTP